MHLKRSAVGFVVRVQDALVGLLLRRDSGIVRGDRCAPEGQSTFRLSVGVDIRAVATAWKVVSHGALGSEL